jgi:hypothetical protein
LLIEATFLSENAAGAVIELAAVTGKIFHHTHEKKNGHPQKTMRAIFSNLKKQQSQHLRWL